MGKILNTKYTKTKTSRAKINISAPVFVDDLEFIRLSALAKKVPYTSMIRQVLTLWRESEEEDIPKMIESIVGRIQSKWCNTRKGYKDFDSFKKEAELELYQLRIPKHFREQIIKKLKAYD